jgi:hypothetical protein
MNNTYNLGNKLRTYALVAYVAAGSMLYTSCKDSTSIPVSEEVKTELMQKEIMNKNLLEEKVNNLVMGARNSFNASIKDNIYSVEEQQQTYNLYESASNLIRENNLKSFAPEDKELYNLLRENLKGIDYGKPELQMALEDRDLNITVERAISDADGFPPILAGFVGFLSLYVWSIGLVSGYRRGF